MSGKGGLKNSLAARELRNNKLFLSTDIRNSWGRGEGEGGIWDRESYYAKIRVITATIRSRKGGRREEKGRRDLGGKGKQVAEWAARVQGKPKVLLYTYVCTDMAWYANAMINSRASVCSWSNFPVYHIQVDSLIQDAKTFFEQETLTNSNSSILS